MILIAYERGASSERAISVAASLLRGGHAHVIHVWEPLAAPTDVYSAIAPRLGAATEDAVAQQEREAQATAQAGAALARAAGFEADGEAICVDDVADALEDAVDRLAPDVIVVGSQARTGFRALLEGSVAHHVSAHAHAPVLTVPPPRPGGATHPAG
jgi:nucleotide-binding universal stress UspA family protein